MNAPTLHLDISLPVPVFHQKAQWMEARASKICQELLKKYRDENYPDHYYNVMVHTDSRDFFVRVNDKPVPELEQAISDYIYDTKAHLEFERTHPDDQ